MKLILAGYLQMALSSIYLWFETHISSGSEVIDVSYHSSAQNIMVKTT